MTRTLHLRALPALRTAALWLLSLPWYALGLVAGLVVALALWVMAAIIAGYAAGRGR